MKTITPSIATAAHNERTAIATIAAHNERTGGFYFSKDTLYFFYLRMEDFQAKTLKDGRIIVYAYNNTDRGLACLAVYDPLTGSLSNPTDQKTLEDELTERNEP